MRHTLILTALLFVALAFLAGCVSQPETLPTGGNASITVSVPTAPDHGTEEEVVAAPEEEMNTSVPAPTFDKFLLWSNGTMLRGADIHQRRLYADLDGGEFMGPGPFGPPLNQDDFDNLSKAGANLVVLSHPGIFDEKPPYALNESAQENLDKLIDMAQKADLFVVIAFRTGPGRSEMSFFCAPDDMICNSYKNDDVWNDTAAQDAWAQMWKYTAGRYKNRTAVAGYELMVEPNSNAIWFDLYNAEDFYPAYENMTYDWNVFYPEIVSAIRESDNETPILVSSLSWSSVRWLPWLKPVTDNRTLYTVHQYDPHDYTHQERTANGGLPISYPSRFDTNGSGIQEDFNKTWIDALLSNVDWFRNRYNATVAVTEYGAIRWEPGAGQFLDDEMSLFEQRGMGYAIWEWQGSYRPQTDSNNEFNFRFGSDQNSKGDSDSKLYDAIMAHWADNAIRPSKILTDAG